MGPRFLILLILAAGMAIYLGMRTSKPAAEIEAQESEEAVFDFTQQQVGELREEQMQLSVLPLDCDEPPEPPELSISWEVPTGDKQVIHYFIDEAHGYYVETFDLEFYYKPTPDSSRGQSPLVVSVYVDNYLKANDTFTGCAYVTANEMKGADVEHMGSTENWGARIVDYGRYCGENPDPLRKRSTTGRCLGE